MRLGTVLINNFRSCTKTALQLDEYTPIVGYNNAGKSNALRAICWLLQGESLGPEDACDDTKDVEVCAAIEGLEPKNLEDLDPTHRARIADYVRNGRLLIRRVAVFRPGVKGKKNELYVAAGDSQALDVAEWKKNPGGIDEAIAALFPEPIVVPAMSNAAEDVMKSSTTSTIGRLVGEVIVEIKKAHQADIDRSLDGIKQLFDAKGATRAQILKDLDSAATQELRAIFPEIALRLHVPVPSLDNIFKGATVKTVESLAADSAPVERDVVEQGHGVQRSIQIALIRLLADRQGTGGKSTNTMLLIEEPELYLHPHAIELTRSALKKLAGNGYQVIAVTHSPQFVAEEDMSTAIMLRKDAGRGTYCLSSLRQMVEKRISECEAQADILFSLTNSSQLLFADTVVLFEGQAERRLLPFLYEAIHGVTPMCRRVAMIGLGGSGNCKKAKDILDAMGLPTRVIADLDFACRTAPTQDLLPLSHPGIQACKAALSALASQGVKLQADGWPTKGGALSPEQAFALIAKDPALRSSIEQLHNELKAKGYWIWTRGAFEEHLGIEGKKVLVHNTFMARAKADWRAAVPDSTGIEVLMAWIHER